MDILKALPAIGVVILLKFLEVQLTKRQIYERLESLGAKNILMKWEKMEYRYDLYHVTYELDDEWMERHIKYSMIFGVRGV